MGEICAILKIRCQDQDQAQEDLLQEGINMHSEKTTIRLVAVDMDGTLLHDDKSISDYTLDVLRRIVKKGVILVPASGRPIGGMKEAVLNNVDGIQYAICSNGAMLMDVPEEKSICETGIPTEKAVEAIARQPEAESKISKALLLGCALAEATAIYGFVIALVIILFLK